MRWGHGVGLADVLLAVTLYMVTGFGIAAGFHRLSLNPPRNYFPLKKSS
jgi:fatty-acid desaturase